MDTIKRHPAPFFMASMPMSYASSTSTALSTAFDPPFCVRMYFRRLRAEDVKREYTIHRWNEG